MKGLLRYSVLPSAGILVGNPSDPPTMRRMFKWAKAYLEGKEETLDLEWFRALNILEGTDTQVRIDAALLDYYKDDDKESIIFVPSGDKLREDSKQPCTDALLIAVYLLLKGVPREQILLEEKAADTSDNARFSVRVISRKVYQTKARTAEVTIYSEKNHLRRFRYAFLGIRFWRWVQGKRKLTFKYRSTGPELSAPRVVLEFAFLVGLMPLGQFNPVGAALRARRRATGRKP